MNTVRVLDVINAAKKIHNDVLKVRWPDQELLDWYNDAMLEIINKRPDLLVKTDAFSCQLGTLQALPGEALRFIRVIRNNLVSKRAISAMDMDTMDHVLPDWHDESSPTDAAEHFLYDNKDPKHFYLYPAVKAAHSVILSYTYAPAKVALANFTDDATLIEISDPYKSPLIDWVLYRAFSKDLEFAGNRSRADKHYAAFYQGLGVKLDGDMGISTDSDVVA
jgi:hypothetical protein